MALTGASPQTDPAVGEADQQEQTANPATSVQEQSRGSSSAAPMPGLSVPGPMMDLMTTVDRRAPLVGRDELLADLVTFSAVDDPEGSASVLIGGDAGVGKTRLLLALRDRAVAAGRLVVVGHSLDFGDSALPYLPFSEILGRLQDELPAVVDTVAQTYPAIVRLLPRQRVRVAEADGADAADRASGGDDRSSRSDLFAGIHALLEEAGRKQPLLVVVEDAHWADQSSRELLSYLFARQLEAPVSLVVSYRSDDVHRRHPLRPTLAEWSRLPTLHRLQVGPLSEASVRALVHALHPDPLTDEQVRAIISRADGNAFFVEELSGMEGLSSATTLPVDLADLLLVRLDRLDEPSRRVVGAASVAGRRVSHELLARVLAASGSDAQDLDLGLRQAVDALILEPRQAGNQPGYAFRHALLSEAVYDDLLPGERARLHTAYVTALQDGSIPGTSAELALHARAANDIETAIAASTEAGDEAMRVGAPEEAAQHYQSALEMLGPRAAVEVGLVASAADALVDAGDAYRAVKLVSAHLEMLPDTAPVESRARLLLAKAESASTTEVDFDPLDLTTEALALIPEEPPSKLRARALMIHSQAQRWHHNTEAAAASASEAVQMATELGFPGWPGPPRWSWPRWPTSPASRTTPSPGSRRCSGRRAPTSTWRSGPCTSWLRCTSASDGSPTRGVSTSRPWRGPRRVGGPGRRGASTPGPSPPSPPTSSATGTACSRSPTRRARRRRPWPRPTCGRCPSTCRRGVARRRRSTTSPPSARSGSGTARWCSTARPRRSTSTVTAASSWRLATSTTTPSPPCTGCGRAASCGCGCG